MPRDDQSITMLLIDNYDSFTFNLYHYLVDCGEVDVVVIRNDDARFHVDDLRDFDGVVISPGPGTPERRADFGVCADVIRAAEVPLLGVCLGHQGICHVFGGPITRAPEPYHGRTSVVSHCGDELFAGVPSPFPAVRYHSLIPALVPEDLRILARTSDGIPMAVRHVSRPLWGVQFHPESICTRHGHTMIENFTGITRRWRAGAAAVPRVGAHLLAATEPKAQSTGRPQKAEPPRLPHRVLVRRVAAPVDAESAYEEFYRDSEHAFWLDSSLVREGVSRFSFMGDASGPLARVATFDVRRGEITVASSAGRTTRKMSFFDWLGEELAGIDVELPDLPFEFALGWVGYLGYELKAETGGASVHASDHPDAWMVFADRAIAFDHARREAYALALAPSDATEPAIAWLDDTQRRLLALGPPPPAPACVARGLGKATLHHHKEKYLNLIAACKEEIAAGESYEICLTNMVELAGTIDPWPAYRALRRKNPVPHGAYLRCGHLAVLSCSPERLLRVSADGTAESKPIKGTRPRGRSIVEDQTLRADLASNQKDRAENLMIVDLVRNDLGRCAEPGGVEVDRLFDVETYTTVHQLVSTVRARLRPGVAGADCVRAVFPGGSMTGAPKIRTMQIIDRLEARPRGIYSGSIGYFSLSGALDLSIVIRTLVAVPGRITFGVGGAIIALSDEEAEFEETAVKATALLSLIGQEFPQRHEPVTAPSVAASR